MEDAVQRPRYGRSQDIGPNITYVLWRVEAEPGDIVRLDNPLGQLHFDLYVTEAGEGDYLASGQMPPHLYRTLPASDAAPGSIVRASRSIVHYSNGSANTTASGPGIFWVSGGYEPVLEIRRPEPPSEPRPAPNPVGGDLPPIDGLDFVWMNRTSNLTEEERAVLSGGGPNPSFVVLDGGRIAMQSVLAAVEYSLIVSLAVAGTSWVLLRRRSAATPTGPLEAAVDFAERAGNYLKRLRLTLLLMGTLLLLAGALGYAALDRWTQGFGHATPAGWTGLVYGGYTLVLGVAAAAWAIQLLAIHRELQRWRSLNVRLASSV